MLNLNVMIKLLCLIVLLPAIVSAQQKEEVVNLSGKSAKELYSSAKEWFAICSNSGNVTIEVDDPEEQKIIGKGIKNIICTLQKSPTFIEVYYALRVQFRDGRYKYHLDVNSIKYEDGFEISYEDFKSLRTKEGWNAYFQKLGIKPPFRSRTELADYDNVNTLVDNDFENILTDLTTHLKSDQKEINW